MLAFVIRRLLQSVGVMLTVAFISFSLFQFVGDPVNNMLGQEATVEDRENLRERLGLNDAIPIQFFRFVSNAMQGDFGVSYRMARPVNEVIMERLPATLELAIVSGTAALLLKIW